jgi:hypothetical protein
MNDFDVKLNQINPKKTSALFFFYLLFLKLGFIIYLKRQLSIYVKLTRNTFINIIKLF